MVRGEREKEGKRESRKERIRRWNHASCLRFPLPFRAELGFNPLLQGNLRFFNPFRISYPHPRECMNPFFYWSGTKGLFLAARSVPPLYSTLLCTTKLLLHSPFFERALSIFFFQWDGIWRKCHFTTIMFSPETDCSSWVYWRFLWIIDFWYESQHRISFWCLYSSLHKSIQKAWNMTGFWNFLWEFTFDVLS